jgi:hypothetical protein
MEQTPAREYYQEQDSQDTLYVAQGLILDGQEEHTDRGLTRGLVVAVVVKVKNFLTIFLLVSADTGVDAGLYNTYALGLFLRTL